MKKGYHHLTYNDRLKIEALYMAKHTPIEIADIIGVNKSTIYRELKRGRYIHTLSTWEEEERYSPEISDQKYRASLKVKGRGKKIENDTELISFIERKILNDKFSPYATLAYIRNNDLKFDTQICLSTLYNYIREDIFENIELSDLPYKRTKGKKKKRVQKRASRGTSIEKRPSEVDDRDTIGHWEMDTVKGKRGKSQKSLLVLTERKSRIEILELMKNNTMDEVVKALDRIERRIGEKKFRETFLTITVDNGVEFSDCDGIERSRRNKKKRTSLYYCHPYSSCERGSNENQNKLVRRHIPKGLNFDDYSKEEIRKIEIWINTYPREMFSDRSAEEIYRQEFQETFWRLAG